MRLQANTVQLLFSLPGGPTQAARILYDITKGQCLQVRVLAGIFLKPAIPNWRVKAVSKMHKLAVNTFSCIYSSLKLSLLLLIT